MNTDYTIYTDGGCLSNPGGRGGYGLVIIENTTGRVQEYKRGPYKATTNNRMEMLAVLDALWAVPEGKTAEIISDSQYVINTLSGNWRKNKNADIWAMINKAEKGKTVRYKWIRGHAGNKYNERCDELAKEAMEGEIRWIDEGYCGGEVPVAKNIPKIKVEVPEEMEDERRFDSLKEAKEKGFVLNDKCAKAMISFWKDDKKNFQGYLRLKTGGMDQYSRFDETKLRELYDDTIWDKVKEYLADPKHQLSCLRWHARGLSLTDSIRKELVSAEIERNATEAAYKKGWL